MEHLEFIMIIIMTAGEKNVVVAVVHVLNFISYRYILSTYMYVYNIPFPWIAVTRRQKVYIYIYIYIYTI